MLFRSETRESEKKPNRARATSPRREIPLAEYLDQCQADDRKAIPPHHPVRAYCEDAGITEQMLHVAWVVFKDRHLNNAQAKKYVDWPKAFENSVKDRWYRLWRANEEGHADWSTEGLQARRVIETRLANTQEHVQKGEDQHAPA